MLVKENNYRLLLHILFWVVIMGTILFAVINTNPHENIEDLILHMLIIFSFIVSGVYINLYYLVPSFLLKKRYFIYVIGLIIIIVVYTYLKVFVKIFMFEYPVEGGWIEEIASAVAVITSFIIITTLLKYLMQFFNERIKYAEIELKLKDIEKQKLEAELNALKGQLNPHFLFNTLNNLYTLSLDNSKKTPELILKLSELLNYSLYECKDKYVPLNHEISFLNSYIELEKIRLDDEVLINMQIKGNAGNIKIAPLIFMPLFENAFKHGVNKRPDNPFVNINFDFSNDGSIKFKIENNIKSNTTAEKPESGGIGIKNVEKRLELLYPEKYSFEIEKGIDIFTVNLEIIYK